MLVMVDLESRHQRCFRSHSATEEEYRHSAYPGHRLCLGRRKRLYRRKRRAAGATLVVTDAAILVHLDQFLDQRCKWIDRTFLSLINHVTSYHWSLNQGIHVMHLFYRIDRVRWSDMQPENRPLRSNDWKRFVRRTRTASHPRICTLRECVAERRTSVSCFTQRTSANSRKCIGIWKAVFPRGLQPVYNYLSVTELSEYMPTEEDNQKMLAAEKLEPGTEAYNKRMAELTARKKEYRTVPALSRIARLGGNVFLPDEQAAAGGR